MLDTLINDGWGYHDSKSERLAQELECAPLGELTAAQAGPFLSLANHTLGEHLGDWSRARGLAERVCAQSMIADGSAQAWVRLAVARILDGDWVASRGAELNAIRTSVQDGLIVSLETALSTAIALIGSQRIEEGQRLYQAAIQFADDPLAASMQTEKEIMRRRSLIQLLERTLAIASNNIARELLDVVDRTLQQNALMQSSAEAALRFWKRCGNWQNEERGLYLLTLVANASGKNEEALSYSHQGLAVISRNDAEPVDEAFIRLAAAEAHLRLGDQKNHRSELHRADELAASWEDESLCSWFADERRKVVA